MVRVASMGIFRFTIFDLRFTIPRMDIESSYNKALDYLYSFVDYSLKHSSELAKAEFNLDRMFALMEELGNPQSKYPIIHVAGTKGKGSVCALCASGLKVAGYKVGLYTSPHLLDFCERIQVGGEPIPHEFLVELVEEIKPAVAKIPKLTTFEITTALGFLAFAKQGCNAAVIEVGLGGRLDATNIVMPKVSVITSLSYDHMAVLGDTLAKIAGEKAGIIKRGVPVVSSSQKDEALEVLERVAKLEDSSFTLIGKEIKVYPNIGARTFSPPDERTFSSSNKRTEVRVPEFESIASSLDGQSLRIVDDLRLSTFNLQLPLLGSHQLENAATAYAALKVSGLEISDEAIQKGFAQVKWGARFEIARREPPVIFDSAHNEDSFVKLRETLDTYFPDKKAYLIFGASEDKNIPGMFAAMEPKIQRLIVTRADHPRALEEGRIVELARQAEIESEAVSPVESALARALELSAKDGSIVLSAGSMFVTAEVMRAWNNLMSLRGR